MRIRCMNCGEAFEINDENCTTEEERRVLARFALTDHILMKHATVAYYLPANEYEVQYTDLGEVERCIICEHTHEKDAMHVLTVNLPNTQKAKGEIREGFVCQACKNRLFSKKNGEWEYR